MKYSIILVVYDPLDNFSHAVALPSAIKSISTLNGDYELIMVNNHDPSKCPNTTHLLRSTAKSTNNTKLLELDKNFGCAGGFNKGAELSDPRSEALIYMSCDAYIVDPQILYKFDRIFAQYPRICALHPLSIYEDIVCANYSNKWNDVIFNHVKTHIPNDIPWDHYVELPKDIMNITNIVLKRKQYIRCPVMQLPLTFYAVKTNIFKQLRGFNDGFIAGYENIDFCLRALRQGYRSAIINNSFVYHRRDLFYALGQHGTNGDVVMKSACSGKAAWQSIWHDDPSSAYYRIRYGILSAAIIKCRHIIYLVVMPRLRRYWGNASDLRVWMFHAKKTPKKLPARNPSQTSNG